MNSAQALNYFLNHDDFIHNIRAEDRSRLLNQARV